MLIAVLFRCEQRPICGSTDPAPLRAPSKRTAPPLFVCSLLPLLEACHQHTCGKATFTCSSPAPQQNLIAVYCYGAQQYHGCKICNVPNHQSPYPSTPSRFQKLKHRSRRWYESITLKNGRGRDVVRLNPELLDMPKSCCSTR